MLDHLYHMSDGIQLTHLRDYSLFIDKLWESPKCGAFDDFGGPGKIGHVQIGHVQFGHLFWKIGKVGFGAKLDFFGDFGQFWTFLVILGNFGDFWQFWTFGFHLTSQVYLREEPREGSPISSLPPDPPICISSYLLHIHILIKHCFFLSFVILSLGFIAICQIFFPYSFNT